MCFYFYKLEVKKMLKWVVLSISIMLLSPPVINGILPEMRDSLGITQAESELITTIPSIASLIVILLSHLIVKKVGIKKMIFAGLMLVGIGGVLPVVVNHHLILVLVGRTILGVGLGLYSPFAIDLINLLFDEHERATLMGYRSVFEQLGQSLMAMSVGLLAVFGWNMSFMVYGFAFVLAVLFFVFVPELEAPNTDGSKAKIEEKCQMSPVVYLIVMLAIVVVLNGAAIGIRFPALAAEIRGSGYNSSLFFVLKPMIGICAGFFFGKLHKAIGRKLLYVGLVCLGVASLLVGFSNGNFVILVSGFLLSSLMPAWIFPFIFMLIAKTTDGYSRKLAMSLVLIALNATVFAMTPMISVIEMLVGSTALAAPYPVLGGLILTALLCMMLFGTKLVGHD